MKIKGLHFCSFDPYDEFGLPNGTRYRQHNNEFISFPSSNPITIDTTTSTTFNNNQNPTVSLTVGSNSNRLVLIGIAWSNATPGITISSITGGGTFTQAKHKDQAISGSQAVDFWYNIAPTTGSNTWTVNFSGAGSGNYGVIVIYSFYNVKQTSPIGVTTFTGANSGTSESQSLTPTNTGAWILDMIITWNDGSTAPSSPNATQQFNVLNSNVPLHGASQYNSHPTINSSNTLSWTVANNGYAGISIELISI